MKLYSGKHQLANYEYFLLKNANMELLTCKQSSLETISCQRSQNHNRDQPKFASAADVSKNDFETKRQIKEPPLKSSSRKFKDNQYISSFVKRYV